MKLPYREKAYIEPSKLTGYLLSKTHSTGRWKRQAFIRIGFNETNVEALESCLIAIAKSGEVEELIPSPYGIKYIIDGSLKGPSGGTIEVNTVWIIEEGQYIPRFVTAYPM